ncbi:acyl-CoA dehydrogenase family protein [Rhodococcoides kyotonense]|uniref:Acyl-CoA dehydrogenase n=1 Tax=Rhodococcoides kyotonense TaxID=398843 RepID=A0A239GAT3_9NOCA|nr:acyl-CoA dehydrogenase family protein [Rhodococcus kyotonensis]SNS66229.1 Acyl-CoA dehydrogenase [Rhodococcus kyotonensis]
MTTTIDVRDTDTLVHRAPGILGAIAAGAAERESDRVMPYSEIAAIIDAGFGTWRVPAEYGGPDASLTQFFEFAIALATADANIAQALRSHFAFVETLRRSPSDEEKARWFERVLAGDTFGLASGETGGVHGVISSRLTAGDDGHTVDGTKFYSTGTLFADWIVVRAVDDDEKPRSFVLPSNRAGIERIDDWDGIGQRLTASGTTTFSGVRVEDSDFLIQRDVEGARPRQSPFFQLFLAAVEVGIAKNALADAVEYARGKARPIKHAGVSRSVDDPYVQHAVGEMAARTYAAEAGVLRAAAAIDRTHGLDPHGAEEDAAVLAASLEVSQAQFFAIEAALKTSELLFDVGGASTALRSHNFDRHWRNARTVANHNPRAYKASVVGAYLLADVEPPITGFF